MQNRAFTKIKYKLFALFIISSFLVSCNFILVEDSNDSTVVWGSVAMDSPADEANITIEQRGSIVWQGTCTKGHFQWYTSQLSGGELRAIADNITINSVPYSVEISAYVSDYDTGYHIDINLFTTLVDRYIRYYDSSYDEAVSAVERNLHLQAGLDYSAPIMSEALKAYFDPKILMAEAAEYGGLDAYLDHLVIDVMSIETPTLKLNALYSPAEDSLMKDLPISAAEAAAVALGKETAGELLKNYGVVVSDPANQTFLDTLNAQNAKLTQIENQISALNEDVVNLENELGSAIVDMLFDNSDQNILDAVNNLQNLATRLKTNYTSAAAQGATPLNQHYFAISMIGNNALAENNVPGMISTIHINVVPDGASDSKGSLGDYALSVQSKGGHGNLLQKYMVLEAYFAKILSLQHRGLILVTEAINALESGDTNVQYNSNETYINSVFQPLINEEIDEFMRWVDYLVIANSDFDTDLVKPVQFAPDNSGAVYERADFIAQMFSTEHRASADDKSGFVIRLIGQPKEIDDFVSAGGYEAMQMQNGTNMSYDLKLVYHTVYDLESSDFYVSDKPSWAKPYIQWSYAETDEHPSVKDYISGTSTTKYSVAKFVGQDIGNSNTLSAPTEWGTGWGLVSGGNFFDQAVHWSGIVSDMIKYYVFDENNADGAQFDVATANTSGSLSYGSHLYVVRHFPNMSKFGTIKHSTITAPPWNQVSSTFDNGSMKFSFLADIKNINYSTSSHDEDGHQRTLYVYSENHHIDRTIGVTFYFEQPAGEDWELLINSSISTKYTGSKWPMDGFAELNLLDVPYPRPHEILGDVTIHKLRSHYGYSVADQHFGEYDYAYPFRTDGNSKHTLKFEATMDGSIDKSSPSHLNLPKYVQEANVQITKMLFHLKSKDDPYIPYGPRERISGT